MEPSGSVSTIWYWVYLCIVLASCVIAKVYLKYTTKWCKNHTCLVGKTVLITGATSGIGYETAVDLAKRGARVIVGSITQKEGDEAKSKIIDETDNENIVVAVVDMSSFKSVRAFARKIIESENRLDILINNAGVIGIGDIKTDDGCLYMMQVNYFSPYLLTHLLMGLLKKTPSSRIINVASCMAQFVYELNVEKLNEFPGHYGPLYSRSKLCLVLFTKALARRIRNTGVTTYSVHPGIVKTNIFTNVKRFGKFVILLGSVFFKTAEEGAQTTIHCATAQGIELHSGEHFVECQKVQPYVSAMDWELGENLWEATKDVVQLKPDESRI